MTITHTTFPLSKERMRISLKIKIKIEGEWPRKVSSKIRIRKKFLAVADACAAT